MDLFRCPSLHAPKSVLKLTRLSNRLKNSHQFSTMLTSSKWYISFTFKFSVPFNHKQCIFKISCNPHILSSTENRENNAKVKLSMSFINPYSVDVQPLLFVASSICTISIFNYVNVLYISKHPFVFLCTLEIFWTKNFEMDFWYTITFSQYIQSMYAYKVCTTRKWKQYIRNPAEMIRFEKILRVHMYKKGEN